MNNMIEHRRGSGLQRGQGAHGGGEGTQALYQVLQVSELLCICGGGGCMGGKPSTTLLDKL